MRVQPTAPDLTQIGPRPGNTIRQAEVIPQGMNLSRRGMLGMFTASVGMLFAQETLAAGHGRLKGKTMDVNPPEPPFDVPLLVAGSSPPGSWANWTDLSTVDPGYVQQGSGFGSTQAATGGGWLVGQHNFFGEGGNNTEQYVGVFVCKGSSVDHIRMTGDDVGIQYVDFWINGAGPFRQTELKQDPIKGIWGYWVKVKPIETTGGQFLPIEIRAVQVPVVGMPYALQGTPNNSRPYAYGGQWWSLFWFLDGAGTKQITTIYLDTFGANGGNDSNNGLTYATPVLTVVPRAQQILAAAQGVAVGQEDWSYCRLRYWQGQQLFGAQDGKTRATQLKCTGGHMIVEPAPENTLPVDWRGCAQTGWTQGQPGSGGYFAEKLWVKGPFNHTGNFRLSNVRFEASAASARNSFLMSDVTSDGTEWGYTTDSVHYPGIKFWSAQTFCDNGDWYHELINCYFHNRSGSGLGNPTLLVLNKASQLGSNGDIVNNPKMMYGNWWFDQQASTTAVHVDGVQWKLGVGFSCIVYQRIGDRSLVTELYKVQGLFSDSGGLYGQCSVYKPDLRSLSSGSVLGFGMSPTNLTFVLDQNPIGAVNAWGTADDAVDCFMICVAPGIDVDDFRDLRFGLMRILPETIMTPTTARYTAVHPLIAARGGGVTDWAALVDATIDECHNETYPGSGLPLLHDIIDPGYVGTLKAAIPNDPFVCMYDGTAASKSIFNVNIPNHGLYRGANIGFTGVDETGDPNCKFVTPTNGSANISVPFQVAAVIDADHVKIDMTGWAMISATAGHETDPIGGAGCGYYVARRKSDKMDAGGTTSFEYAGPERYAGIGFQGGPGYRFKRTPVAPFTQAVTCVRFPLEGRLTSYNSNSAVEIWMAIQNLETTSDSAGNIVVSFGTGSSSGQFKVSTHNGTGGNTGKRTVQLVVGSGGSTKSTADCPVPFEGAWSIIHAYWDPVLQIMSIGCWNDANSSWANDSTRYAVPTTQPATVTHGGANSNRAMWGGICTSNTGNLWKGIGVVLGVIQATDTWTQRQAIFTQLRNLCTTGAYADNDNELPEWITGQKKTLVA